MDDIEERFKPLVTVKTKLIQSSESTESAAAVLILLVKLGNLWNIVYTRRTTNVRTHQGEVSFPGGAFEKKDESLLHTALRETYEEIGVKQECVRIIGGLEPVRTISNFMVYPFVGFLNCELNFKVNPEEVEKVFMIPVSWLEDSNNFYEMDHLVENQFVHRVIHYHDYDGEHLWGLTARITQKILEIK